VRQPPYCGYCTYILRTVHTLNVHTLYVFSLVLYVCLLSLSILRNYDVNKNGKTSRCLSVVTFQLSPCSRPFAFRNYDVNKNWKTKPLSM